VPPGKGKRRQIDDLPGFQRDLVSVSLVKQTRSESMGEIPERISFDELFDSR
jgi:hypothetical protein